MNPPGDDRVACSEATVSGALMELLHCREMNASSVSWCVAWRIRVWVQFSVATLAPLMVAASAAVAEHAAILVAAVEVAQREA